MAMRIWLVGAPGKRKHKSTRKQTRTPQTRIHASVSECADEGLMAELECVSSSALFSSFPPNDGDSVADAELTPAVTHTQLVS